MNNSIMMGRLVRDPQMNYIENDKGEEVPVANFRIAVDRKFSDKTDFFPCSAFGWLAEFTEKYLYQGIKVIVNGRMENNNYTNKDGEQVYGVCLKLNEIDFAESKNAQMDDDDEERGSASGGRRSNSKGRGSSGNSRSGRSNSGRSGRSSQSSSRRSSSRNSNSGNGRSSRGRQVDEDFDNMNDDYNFN